MLPGRRSTPLAARGCAAPRARSRWRRRGHVRHDRRGRDRLRAAAGARQRRRSHRLEQIVNFAYPAADCILLSVAVIGAAVAGWRAGLAWSLLAVGALALVIGDIALGPAGPRRHVGARDELQRDLPAVATGSPPPPSVSEAREHALVTRRRAHARRRAGAAVAALVPAGRQRVGRRARRSRSSWPASRCSARSIAPRSRWPASVRESLVAARERELVDEVRHALTHGELDLHYQPLVDARDRRRQGRRGAPALVPRRRLVPPDQFLPAVERSELMAPLTDFVLDRALPRPRTGPTGTDRHLRQPRDRQPLRARPPGARDGRPAPPRVPPRALTLEITETAEIDDSVDGRARPRRARPAGVGALGRRLRHRPLVARPARPFPICEVKIDRSFVRDMHTSKRPIVATTIQLAHSLGLRVVAEGIEDAARCSPCASSGATSRRATTSHGRSPRPASPLARYHGARRRDLNTAARATASTCRSVSPTERWCSA